MNNVQSVTANLSDKIEFRREKMIKSKSKSRTYSNNLPHPVVIVFNIGDFIKVFE